MQDGTACFTGVRSAHDPPTPHTLEWSAAGAHHHVLAHRDDPRSPGGSYVLFGRSNIAAGPSTVICSLENDAAQNVTVAAGGVVALAQTATVVLDTPRAVTMYCLKSAGSPQVAQASITAIRVESLGAS